MEEGASVRKRILKLILTGGGVGYVPNFPGTTMSLLTVLALGLVGHPGFTVAFFIIVTALGFFLVRSVPFLFQDKDPRPIVIDEAVGMSGALILIPIDPLAYAAAFLLFRFFDSVKPWGIRKIESLHTPQAILWDDLLAAFYTNLIVQIAARLFQIL